MTPSEIRYIKYAPNDPMEEIAMWLREIAYQLAKLNQGNGVDFEDEDE